MSKHRNGRELRSLRIQGNLELWDNKRRTHASARARGAKFTDRVVGVVKCGDDAQPVGVVLAEFGEGEIERARSNTPEGAVHFADVHIPFRTHISGISVHRVNAVVALDASYNALGVIAANVSSPDFRHFSGSFMALLDSPPREGASLAFVKAANAKNAELHKVMAHVGSKYLDAIVRSRGGLLLLGLNKRYIKVGAFEEVYMRYVARSLVQLDVPIAYATDITNGACTPSLLHKGARLTGVSDANGDAAHHLRDVVVDEPARHYAFEVSSLPPSELDTCNEERLFAAPRDISA